VSVFVCAYIIYIFPTNGHICRAIGTPLETGRLLGGRKSRTGDNVLLEAFETFEPSLCASFNVAPLSPSYTFSTIHHKTILYTMVLPNLMYMLCIYIYRYVLHYVCSCLPARSIRPSRIYLLCERTRCRERDLF